MGDAELHDRMYSNMQQLGVDEFIKMTRWDDCYCIIFESAYISIIYLYHMYRISISIYIFLSIYNMGRADMTFVIAWS